MILKIYLPLLYPSEGVQLQQADGVKLSILFWVHGIRMMSFISYLLKHAWHKPCWDIRVEIIEAPDGQVVLKDVLPLSADVKAWIRA